MIGFLGDKYEVLPLEDRDARPDLLIVVNFTMLRVPPDTGINIPRNSVQVYVGLTNNTDDVIATTAPSTLPPGVNLIGIVNLMVRQRLRSPRFSTLGIFDVRILVHLLDSHRFDHKLQAFDTFVISQIAYLLNDPQAAALNIPQAPNISTIRISVQNDPSDWRIIQDYREKSILGGLSSVGGLANLFGVLFVVLFGSSLLRLLFGRPYDHTKRTTTITCIIQSRN
jgi:hypothetical protein